MIESAYRARMRKRILKAIMRAPPVVEVEPPADPAQREAWMRRRSREWTCEHLAREWRIFGGREGAIKNPALVARG